VGPVYVCKHFLFIHIFFINFNVNIFKILLSARIPPPYLQVHMCMFGMGFGSHYLRIVVLS